MNSTTNSTTKSNHDQPRVSLGLKPTFVFLYNFIGKVLSANFKTKKFDMENHESDALAQQSDDLMSEFFPSVQSRWVKLFIFMGSILGIYGKKYLDFTEEQSKKKPDIDVKDTPKVVEAQVHNLPSNNNFPVNPTKMW